MLQRKTAATVNNFEQEFYLGRDPRELPAYEVAEAARYLRIKPVTLHTWLRPVRFTANNEYCEKPLIERPQGSKKLSFLNLVEGHVIKALRCDHEVPMTDIRSAIHYAEQEWEITRLLVHPNLKAGAKQLFLERFGQLINLSRGGQLAVERLLSKYLERIEYQNGIASALIPFVQDYDGSKLRISPDVAFGKPTVASAGITTYAIAERFELGEEKDQLAEDYGITEEEVEEAIVYEAAA